MKPQSNISFLLSLSIVCFLGNFGLGLMFPLFSKLLFDPHFTFFIHSPLRPLFFSFFIALFPFFQFLSTRVYLFWGKRHHQKTILMWSSFFIALGFWSAAYSMKNNLYFPLLLSISFTGFFAGPASFFIPPLRKAKPLGLMLGILTGTLFSEPFWGSGFIALFTAIFLGFSLPKELTHPPSIKEEMKKNRSITSFFLLFGWTSFLQFFPIYFLTFFDKTPFTIPFVTTILCLIFLFTRVWIAPLLYSLTPSRPLFLSLFSGLVFFSLLLLVTKIFFLSTLFHILIAIYVGILFAFFPLTSRLTLANFCIAPLIGGGLYCINLQWVYGSITVFFIVAIISLLPKTN